MQPEQQQRIMGYFIEEAKDHLNTIEQGLLSLQNTMEDTEMVNEVFRAAHSVKGGAGMLGINSIHRTAHRLEDCLKVIQESPVKVDSQLESLFLQVFDTLEALVEQLQAPFGLTDEIANGIMSEAEPVFEQLNTHLEQLVRQFANSNVATAPAPQAATAYDTVPIPANIQPTPKNVSVLPPTFKRDVLVQLREMLEVFKQQDLPEHRNVLQRHCQCLEDIGETVDLPGWGELLETSRMAIACPENSYRQLASLVIKEIKQAQELALAGRSVEIAPSAQLKALVPVSPVSESAMEFDDQELDNLLTSDLDFQSDWSDPEISQSNGSTTWEQETFASNQLNDPDTYIQGDITHIQDDISEHLHEQTFAQDQGLAESDLFSTPTSNDEFQSEAMHLDFRSTNATSLPHQASDPEVGIAELNSLADIFEGQTPDLDQTWQEEEIVNLDDHSLASDPTQVVNVDDNSDFSSLMGDLDDFELSADEASTSEDLMDWLGDNFTDETINQLSQDSENLLDDNQALQHSPDVHTQTVSSTNDSNASWNLPTSDFSDLLFEEENTAQRPATTTTEAEDLNNLFGDSFFDEDHSLVDESVDESLDVGLEAEAMSQLPDQEDDILTMPSNETPEASAFSTNLDHLNSFADQQDILFEGFAGQEEESFSFELEDLGSSESQLEVSDEQAIVADADIDFDDLLEISASNSQTPSKAQDELFFGESLDVSDEATDLSWEELTVDQSEDSFNLSASGDFGFSELELEPADSSSGSESMDLFLDDDFLETPVTNSQSLTDFDLAENLSTNELNGTESSTSLYAQESSLDWEAASEDALNISERDLDDNQSMWDLDESFTAAETDATGIAELPGDFDLDTASSDDDLFNFEEETHASLDSLFENEASSSLETPESVTFNSQSNFDDLFNSQPDTSDTLMFEELAVDSLEDSADNQNADILNEFFNTEVPDALAVDQASAEFDDFFPLEEADSTTLATEPIEHPEIAEMPEVAIQEELFDLQPNESESAAEFSELLFDADDSDLLEIDTSTNTQAATVDLDALLADEIPEDEEAANWSADALNFEEDLFASDTSATEQASVGELELANQQSTDADEMENLDDWLDSQADELSNAQEWNLEAEGDEAAESLDWESTDRDNDATLAALAAAGLGASAMALNSPTSEFDDLEAMLAESETLTAAPSDHDQTSETPELGGVNEFDDLEAMLADTASVGNTSLTSAGFDGFDDLDALLNEPTPATVSQAAATSKNASRQANKALEDEFGDLEKLLEQADKTMGGPPSVTPAQRQQRPSARPRARNSDLMMQTMRVPVKHLDSLSNLVGELVVNRNSLEQDQELLRQFLDNLSHQVLALSDVGLRMQDLYERSLLESSLLAGRQGYRPSVHSLPVSQNPHSTGIEYDPLEMDRFTGFHLLSQEMIELIVRVRESASDIERLVDETDQVARMLRQVTTQLQEGLTRSRMVPFAQTTDRLHRAVRDISLKLRKEAQLHVEGRETLIDKMILEHLSDPMTHLINNALTHGIELPEVRRAAGKPAAGQITLRAFHQGNQTVISVSDDGAGINPERVRNKAIERKLITPEEAKTLTNLDLYNFLFHPGFTTKDKEDEYAGRGVGMDVVLTSMSEIRGTVHIDSTLGKGTTFTIRLPLTLSICKALCCLSDRARLAFPMDGVEDMFDLPNDRVQVNSDGQTCIPWRDTPLPFQPLSELLKYNRHLSRGNVYGGKREDDMISIVVLRSAGNFIAIQVDQVLGEQEIVIKQLEGPAPKPVGIAGATVLGDGRIMPIADVLELIDLAMGRIRKDNVSTLWSRDDAAGHASEELHITKTEPMVLIVDDSITVRELLSMTFTKSGYRVEQARDGQEAWDKLRSGLPCDIVFCDIEMPRMDGLELLSRLQKDETLCNLPIAMLTSRGADRHRQMASQLGANGYFTKPYLEEVLLEAAGRMIKGEVLFGNNGNA